MRCVPTLGEEIKAIRKSSRYTDLESYAGEASLSREGLRKIENGDRLPNRDTLKRLLQVSGIQKGETDRLMRMRDLAQAERDGLTLPHFVTPERIQSIASRIRLAVFTFTDDYDLEFPDPDQRELEVKIAEVLTEEMSG